MSQVLLLAHRSVVRTLRQPAMVVPSLVFPLLLLSINSSGLESATQLPGFPTDSYFKFALAIPFVQGALFSANSAGTNMASDIESGFLNRLSLTPLRRVALMMGQLTGILALGLIQALTFVAVGLVFGAGIEAGPGGVVVLVALSLTISLAFGCIGAFVALRSGNGESVQGVFPLFFAALFLSSMALPRDLIENDWFQTDRDLEPRLLHARGDPLARDRRLGQRGARARLRLRRRRGTDRPCGGFIRAAHPDGAHMNPFVSAARAVAWRNLHNWFTNPAMIVPSLLFPLFFFTAFAGGLSRVDSVPGFDYEAGYTTFVYGFVLLQAATFGGIFTGFSVARDFESGFARRLMLGATNRGGIVAGYWLSALGRAIFTITVITLVALAVGLEVHGNGIDVVGLYTLALLMNAFAVLFGTGVAMRLRTMQAGPAIQTPAFLLLFLAPVWVPYNLLTGWVQGRGVGESGDARAGVRTRLPRGRSDKGPAGFRGRGPAGGGDHALGARRPSERGEGRVT